MLLGILTSFRTGRPLARTANENGTTWDLGLSFHFGISIARAGQVEKEQFSRIKDADSLELWN